VGSAAVEESAQYISRRSVVRGDITKIDFVLVCLIVWIIQLHSVVCLFLSVPVNKLAAVKTAPEMAFNCVRWGIVKLYLLTHCSNRMRSETALAMITMLVFSDLVLGHCASGSASPRRHALRHLNGAVA